MKSTVTQATAIVCAAGSWGDKALVTSACGERRSDAILWIGRGAALVLRPFRQQ